MKWDRKLRERLRETNTFLALRGRVMRYTGGGGGTGVQNLYLPTVQRSGSQWMKNVLADMRIRKYTRLRPFPQRRYEWGEFVKRFPLHTFVPGLYMSYDLYEEIEKPQRYRTVFVMRDPRSLTVSWYHAMRKTHVLMGKVGRYREDLARLDFNDGISYCIKALTGKFADMRTWMDHRDDRNVTILKFEDMAADTTSAIGRILKDCGFDVPADVLANVMREYDKEEMRKRDPRTQADPNGSHYRKSTSDHRGVFTPEHYKLFREVTGNLVSYLGYDDAEPPASQSEADHDALALEVASQV
jgi:hypothetical protein